MLSVLSVSALAAPSQVLVLGPHHTGTSIVARALDVFGVHLGERPELLLDEENPLKFWERRDVVDINKAHLKGAQQPDVPDFVGYGFVGAALDPKLNASAAAVVAKLDAHRPWATKDPRLSLTAKAWLPLLEDDSVCVLTVRRVCAAPCAPPPPPPPSLTPSRPPALPFRTALSLPDRRPVAQQPRLRSRPRRCATPSTLPTR